MLSASEIVRVDSLAGTATLVRRGPVTVTAIRAINTTAAAAYVQLFDASAAADVTVGTTVPDWVVKSDANDPSLGDGLPSTGLVFIDGIVVASTTTATGNTGATQHLRLGIV